MKIGLFGGTFDPIHWGHLRNAEEVREAFSLDRLLFLPTGEPPHKKRGAAASAPDRLEMVRLAIRKNPGFTLSMVEVSRPGKSYSIDTVRYFARTRRARDSFYFREIFELCNFIVTSRPGNANSMSLERMPVAVRRLFCYDPKRKLYRHESGTKLFFFKLTDIAISASDIRGRLRTGRSIRYLLPSEVETYIKRRGLYRGRREGR